ncbi:MAG: hypothetical protein LUD51_08285 [Clostridia bacterium]|nr:hypothetical protein [Clostridia bacterium]
MELPLEYSSKELTYVADLLKGYGTFYVPDIDEYFYHNIMKINDAPHALDQFIQRYNNGEIKCPYKYEDYINNDDMQATVKGMGMDPDSFYLLVMFCYDFSYITCKQASMTIIPQKEIEKLIMLMPDDKVSKMELTIKTEKGCKTIKDSLTVWQILNCLKEKFGDNIGKTQKSYPLKLEDAQYVLHKYQESNSVLIWYFATYMNEFFRLNPKFHGKSKKGETVSYNKRLLISRLVYYTKMSTNKSFLYSPETLNGYLKQYKNKPIRENNLSSYD